MPRFPDAIGFLLELRDTVAEVWFRALCDMAVASTGQEPTVEQLQRLWSYFHQITTYAPTAAAVRPGPPAATATLPAVFLEEIANFADFKKLTTGMHAAFSNQVTLIFGKNASGKSSLCQALKVLASPDPPTEPLHNARARYRGTPSFSYRFRGDPTATTWTEAAGFGSQAQAIKYFDSTVALTHATGTLQPRSVVEISAFRLEVFAYARTIVSAFQTYARNRVAQDVSRVQPEIDLAKQRLSATVNTAAPPFDQWSATNSGDVAACLATLPPFGTAQADEVAELTRALSQFTAASSDEGLRSLRVQHALLDQLANQLASLSQMCNFAPLATLQAAETEVTRKRAASIELSRGAFPPGVNAHQHHALIAAAAAMYDLSAFRAGQHICPLCRQGIQPDAENLFKIYHEHLTSTLQGEIATLDRTLNRGRPGLQRVGSFRLDDFSACRDLLPEGTLDAIIELVEAVTAAVPTGDEPLSSGNAAAYARSAHLTDHVSTIRAAQARLNEAITAGTQNRQEIGNRISALQREIGSLRAHQTVWAARDSLRDLCTRSSALSQLHGRVNGYDFATLLRRMTNMGKDAERELVLGSFEQRLSDEYRKLSGATLAEMGVGLASRGDAGEIIVTPNVGDAPICRVLSEGEQKVHALAVFICEAVTAPHRVLVFDDPATSFDYNYVANFCERLRDLIRDQPQTQLIVLTHNWDFFVNLQVTINRSPGLNGRMSIQVLEDCASVREYSENWDELCDEIAPIIAGPAEPTAADKERVGGLMRRLIERLMNKHVFNEQRHQYKAKALHVSEFHKFTKLVPLEIAEADKLRDIFANLSPPEHDDPRNFYTSRSRAQFATWYHDIQTIKAALEARRP